MQQAVPLTNYQIVKITGDDAVTFLQGQFTTNIEQLDDGWQIAGYCNPKGRLLGLLLLFLNKSDIHAVVDRSICDALLARLKMYVLRSKVSFDVLQFAKIFAARCAHSELGTLETKRGFTLLAFKDAGLLIDLDGEANTNARNDQAFMAEQDWQKHLILNGIPSIGVDTQAMFIPQMVNLDLIGGINFKKGCYTGQEIVARMHYLGKLKQRMFLCDVDTGADKKAGQKVVTAKGRKAGNLVALTESGECLAVLRLDTAGEVLALEDGSPLRPRAQQPWEFEQGDASE